MPLDTRIIENFANSEFPLGWEQKYMPENVLHKLIKESDIIEAFSPEQDHDDPNVNESRFEVSEDLIKFILKSAKKILAISLLSGVESNQLHCAMKGFMSSGFNDSALPVTTKNPHELPWSISKLKWTAAKSNNFLQKQWSFLVPVFKENTVNLEIRKQHILPFKLVSDQRRQGTFSDVWEVEVHKAHQEEPMRKFDGSNRRAHAAIKAMKEPANQSKDETSSLWKGEAKALEDAAGLRHAHIIEVKAIITWEGKGKFFMFQWADGGSLRDFYGNNARPALDTEFVRDIFRQLAGLASALDKLHNYKKNSQDNGSYRHGDLKPENILRFDNGTRVGLFKISDMGLAKHHIDATGLRGPTATRYGTPLYEPPEVTLDTVAARSRRYDIWSMGCVILELIIWLLHGHGELKEFNDSMNQAFGNSSPYWAMDETDTTHPCAILHPNVAACIALIEKELRPIGPTAMGDLLKVLKLKLLVVPLPPNTATFGVSQTSSPTPSGCRASAKELKNDLYSILDNRPTDAEYWSPRTYSTLKNDLKDRIDKTQPLLLLKNKNVPTVRRRQEVCPISSHHMLSRFSPADMIRYGLKTEHWSATIV